MTRIKKEDNSEDSSVRLPDIISNFTPDAVPSYDYSKISAIDVITKYGVSKSTAIYMLQNHWTIADEWQDILSVYYLLHWDTQYFIHALKEGTIQRANITYQVVYHRCNPVMIANSNKLLISFRCLQDEYKAQPIMMVTIA